MTHSAPVPRHALTPGQLDDIELVGLDALATRKFGDGPNEPRLEVSLPLAREAVEARALILTDPEGATVATIAVSGLVDRDGSTALLIGKLEGEVTREYGQFRKYVSDPATISRTISGRHVVYVGHPLPDAQITHLTAEPGPLTLLVRLDSEAEPATIQRMRAALRIARHRIDTQVVAVPLSTSGVGASSHLTDRALDSYAPSGHATVYADPLASTSAGTVVLFTGLSGSGKSTLSRAVHDALLERTEHSITSLDGDVVRRHLSAGLGFSKTDREMNVRRIGWVAAEVARHGGIALCSPIAPFAQTRDEMRSMAQDAGGSFVLVHVATPLDVCESRDRKGMYARARRGEIAEFTGISSPYEVPTNADLRLDTSSCPLESCTDAVLTLLHSRGLLNLHH